MRVEVTQHTLQEIATNYEAAISWVADIGFPIERGRLAEYRRAITELAQNYDTQGWGNFDDAVHRERVCTTLLEVRELVSIHRGFTGLNVDGTKSLQHYLKGPFSPTRELSHNSSNRPRNVGFELYLNALFAFAGFRPTYGTNADLMFFHAEQLFFVEAKRPTAASTIETAIDDANRQLSKYLQQPNNQHAKGLIALDLTKVINPNSKVMPVYNEDHLHTLMYNEDKRQIAALSQRWHRKRHQRTVGVLLHYRILTSFLPTGNLNTLKWIGFVQLTNNPSLAEMNQKLEEAIPLVC